MTSNCMYGSPHPGDAVLVRGRVGNTVGRLCATHYKQHQKALANNGYHFRTFAEMEAREGKELIDDGRETTDQDMDQESDGARSDFDPYDSSPGEESLGPAYVESNNNRPARRQDRPDTPPPDPGERRLTTRPSSPSPTPNLAQGQLEARATAGRDTAQGSGGLVIQPVPALAWWQGAGELQLSDEQREILWQPFDPQLFEHNKFVGWHLPWVYVWQRLLEAFKPAVPQLVPLCEPKVGAEVVLVHYALMVSGKYAAEAWGECERKGDNKKMTVGNAIEGATSEAIRRIGKRLGVNLELWEPSTIRELERRKK